jgi:hypothetical protein
MTKVALPTEVIEFGSSSPEQCTAGSPLSRAGLARRQCAGNPRDARSALRRRLVDLELDTIHVVAEI